jgi:hypothetical protein
MPLRAAGRDRFALSCYRFEQCYSGLQDVITEGNMVSSLPPGSIEAMEQETRSTKIIDFLKFHDSIPLPELSHNKTLQQGIPRFGTPHSLDASPSPSISPPVEEAGGPIPSWRQAKQLFSCQQRPTPEIGMRCSTSASAPKSVPLPPSSSHSDLSARPIGQTGRIKSSSRGTGSNAALFAAIDCLCCSLCG